MRFLGAVLGGIFYILLTLQPSLAQNAPDKSDKRAQFEKRFNKQFLKNRKRLRKKRIRGLSFSEYGIKNPNYKSFKKKINLIKERETIRLDITLESTKAHFPEGSPCNGSEWGSLKTTADSTYHLLPITKNFKMIFEVLPGKRETFPYNSISCVYNPTNPRVSYVRMTGFFVVHHHVIPSAVLHEFRAIAKPSFLN